MGASLAIDHLREKIRRLEAADRPAAGVLPFGVPQMDACLPGGGLALGALHEVGGAGNGALDGACAALFAAGIMARMSGMILWCLRDADLFAPGLAAAGLAADRVVYVEAGDEQAVLACFEEGLRHGGLAGVVAEIGRLPMTGSRRLQLAAEGSGTLGLAIRRWRRPRDADDFGQPTAAATRWRISVLPSAALPVPEKTFLPVPEKTFLPVPEKTFLPVPGIGRPRWRVELIRCRAGECAEFDVEACDAEGRLALPAGLADRPQARPEQAQGTRRSA